VVSSAVYLKGTGKDIPSIADSDSRLSVELARVICQRIGAPFCKAEISGQTAGSYFENCTLEFLDTSFGELNHLRPGSWVFSTSEYITQFEQYGYLKDIDELASQDKRLRAALGDYLIKADIVVSRTPVEDAEINEHSKIVGKGGLPTYSPLRKANSGRQILHASVSCKITLRSDRAQNVRTEGLNLVKNRKGHTPHIVLVTAEPMPSRIASAAMGVGEIDCVYHFALEELQAAVVAAGDEGSVDILQTMLDGNRLRDICDLPFDLAQ
jgi:hypothetical protein